MKFFCLIFSIYFIYLSTFPCGDKKDCNEFAKTHTSVPSDNSEDNSHKDEICTPFCICACCATHFLIQDFQPTLKQEALINTFYNKYKVSKIASAIIPIWQPPKV